MDILLNTLYTSGYVGSLFVLPSARTGGGRRDPKTKQLLVRDSPRVIKARMASVTVASIASLAAVASLAKQRNPSLSTKDVAALLGLWKPGMTLKETVTLIALPLGCTMSLFLGPLYGLYLEKRLPGMRNFSFKNDVIGTLTSLVGLRNYVVGPVSEELLFRSCILGTAAMYGRGRKYLIFVTPLYFGIAHAHHAYETYVLGGKTRQSLQQGILRALFQTLYTSLFGWHASFLYLRTGSILPPILSHIFCNVMGFPQLGQSLHDFPSRKWVILGAYAAGIVAYSQTLWPFTQPSLFADSMFW
ncbi:Abi-domain-containing protein [Cystobasidium minutum MCA 4210]|uniref:Abi-domain-containing protein n=1 Tax=Cystobasidium minutum MCA 4210 TaxID=1397322 RepID=UPI0034CFB2B0|eukprot:jgi/Rhomi1/167278/fgenesh1_kg.2_\